MQEVHDSLKQLQATVWSPSRRFQVLSLIPSIIALHMFECFISSH